MSFCSHSAKVYARFRPPRQTPRHREALGLPPGHVLSASAWHLATALAHQFARPTRIRAALTLAATWPDEITDLVASVIADDWRADLYFDVNMENIAAMQEMAIRALNMSRELSRI